MKAVYIAGPFRGKNAWEVEQNIRHAEELAMHVAELGGAAICPHTNTRFFNGTLTDQYWLDATLELMRRCDAVYLTDDWHRSSGTRAEVEEAKRREMPIFCERGDLGFRSESGLRRYLAPSWGEPTDVED